MLLIVLPFTSIFLPISPLKEALAVKVTIRVLPVIGVAVWKNFQPFSVLVAVQVLALVCVAVDPPILTCSTHLTILHFAFVDITVFHVGYAGTLTHTPLIKAASPDCLGLSSENSDVWCCLGERVILRGDLLRCE